MPAYTELLLAAVSPPKPEKAGDMKDWPEEGERERAAMRLLQLLGADTPQARYAAGQALLDLAQPHLEPHDHREQGGNADQQQPEQKVSHGEGLSRPRSACHWKADGRRPT